MEFDKSRVYTALNAEELEVNSRVAVANNMADLKRFVEQDLFYNLEAVENKHWEHRFLCNNYRYALAYLALKPEKEVLKWTDLRIGDVIKRKDQSTTCMVLSIINRDASPHIWAGSQWISDEIHIRDGAFWLTDEELAKWEKVEG